MSLPGRIAVAAALCVLASAVLAVPHAIATLPWHRWVLDAVAPLGRWETQSFVLTPSSAAHGRVMQLQALLQGDAHGARPVARVEARVSVGGAVVDPALFATVVLLASGRRRRRLLTAAVGLGLLPAVEALTVSSQLFAPLAAARWVVMTGTMDTNPWDRWSWFLQAGGGEALAVVMGLLALAAGRSLDGLLQRRAALGHRWAQGPGSKA